MKLDTLDDLPMEHDPHSMQIFSVRGFARFCEVLKTNKSINALELSNNRLGDVNGRVLANAVFWPKRVRVTTLGLGGNDLEDPPRKLAVLAKLIDAGRKRKTLLPDL